MIRLLLRTLFALSAGYAASLALFATQLPAAAADSPRGPADAIVVLTGGADRVDTAMRLLAEDVAPVLLVTGAHPDTDLAATLRRAGADPALADRVVLGHRARSTRGNAAEAAAFAAARGARRLVIVTSSYHMPRALAELARALPGAVLQPHPVAPPGGTPVALVVSEHAKWLAVVAGLSRLLSSRESDVALRT
jgi:uncharacterized SAM-binding protein YcdF (DUF218 family)